MPQKKITLDFTPRQVTTIVLALFSYGDSKMDENPREAVKICNLGDLVKENLDKQLKGKAKS